MNTLAILLTAFALERLVWFCQDYAFWFWDWVNRLAWEAHNGSIY